jgi:hypothetical protein
MGDITIDIENKFGVIADKRWKYSFNLVKDEDGFSFYWIFFTIHKRLNSKITVLTCFFRHDIIDTFKIYGIMNIICKIL